jgi:hypothetical protein
MTARCNGGAPCLGLKVSAVDFVWCTARGNHRRMGAVAS